MITTLTTTTVTLRLHRVGLNLVLFSVLSLWILFTVSSVQAQETDGTSDVVADSLALKLMGLSDALESKTRQRDSLAKRIEASVNDSVVRDELAAELEEINLDIASMRATFELIALDQLDLESMDDKQSAYDWRQELVLIVAPVLESLKSITEKPRELTELRESIRSAEARVELSDRAVTTVGNLKQTGIDAATSERLDRLLTKWMMEKESQQQKLLVSRSRLERIENSDNAVFVDLWPSIKGFFMGRGLTLLLAAVAAVTVWFALRFFWWVVNRKLFSKRFRRGNPWYRLASYSSYLFTLVFMIVAVMAVLYLRQDLLLLAIALVALAVTAVGLRTFLPRYMREARLLLNIGPVREDERVIYNGLPWQVMSLNIESVLRNPALEGVLRLPLEAIESLTSRPIADVSWFPTRPGDRVFLPDGSFATVLSQTPELVNLAVRGGMVKTVPTNEFYAMQVTNICGGDTFGVAVTFGLDYSLQGIALTEVPEKLRAAVENSAAEAGYADKLSDIMIELNSAGSSSLDYLIYLTADVELAGQYYALKRMVLHACLDEANRNNWTVPFPQMTLHHQNVVPA